MAEIIPITSSTAVSGVVVEGVVDGLQELLDLAKRGEIRGFVIAFMDGGEVAHSVINRGVCDNAPLGGALAMAHYEYFSRWASV